MGLQAEALGLERDRAAAGERVEDRRRVAARRPEDLRVRLGEQRLIARVLPDDEPLDDAMQPLALGALRVLGREAIGMRGRVVDELGEQHGAGGGERPARPPQVQRRRVAVADRLLARGLPVDRLQRQRHLDQLALRRAARHCPSGRSSSAQNGSRPRAQVVSHLPRWPVASKSPASKPANGFSR